MPCSPKLQKNDNLDYCDSTGDGSQALSYPAHLLWHPTAPEKSLPSLAPRFCRWENAQKGCGVCPKL